MPEKVDQVIKQASRDESNNQAPILTIKGLDRRRMWKYRAHSSDCSVVRLNLSLDPNFHG